MRGKNLGDLGQKEGGFSLLARHPPFFGKNPGVLGVALGRFFPIAVLAKRLVFRQTEGGATAGPGAKRRRFLRNENGVSSAAATLMGECLGRNLRLAGKMMVCINFAVKIPFRSPG
jgi:hypothetical protein